MSVTKKYRCRYFEEDGRPIHPTCNQGSSCRFVHPTDPNWPGLKPFVDTRLLNKPSSASKRNKEVTRAAGSNNSSEGRGPALVSQSDLFLRCKVEGDESARPPERSTDRGRPLQKGWDPKLDRDRDAQRDRDRRRIDDHREPMGPIDRGHNYSRNRSSSPVRSYAKKHDRTGSDNSRTSELDASRNKGPRKQGSGDLISNELKRRPEVSSAKPKGSMDPKAESASSSVQNPKWIDPASAEMVPKMHSALPAPPLQLSDEQKRVERLVGLFRSLARLSNQVVQETAAHEREGQKLQTYTEISTALSKISASAATAVAPTLADIMLKHEQCKHRAEESFRALGGVWEQVFDVFVTEVVHVIDAGLQSAITTLKKEGEHAAKDIVANLAGSLKHGAAGDTVVPYDRKRGRTRGPAEKENEDSRSGRATSRDRDHKRRRFSSHSSSPDSRNRRPAKHGDSGIEDILTQMKMKIDQQAHSLQILTKENSELKTTLKQAAPPISSCSSFSVSSTPQEPTTPGSRSADTTPTKPRLSAEQMDYYRSFRDGQ
ncbi:hypothetical protein DFH07DRAFT_106910 [Mycena maculata]|uniref:C3H1-type domain-containing protein n=1 Tax=Mycena maculata TaxID=230809 RepID=A0AAD7JYQ9_9AGAR|nr:hypothetical protein DFH07DRAFT_106910 [Mycena maculata]